MAQQTENSSVSIPTLLARSAAVLYVFSLSLSLALLSYLFDTYFTIVPQYVYRDTLALFGNELAAEAARENRPTLLTESTWADVLPASALVLADLDGTIVESSRCHSNRQRIEPFPFANDRQLRQLSFPQVPGTPCEDFSQFLSAVSLWWQGQERILLLYGTTDFRDAFFSVSGLQLLLSYLFPLLILSTLGTVVAVWMTNRSLFRYAIPMEQQIRTFSEGNRQLRLQSIPMDELDELVHAFNRMADDESARITEIETTDALRKRMLLGLIHDLRTPMTAIAGAADRLAVTTDAERSAQYRQILEAALGSQIRYARMLRDLAEVTPSSMRISTETVDLDTLLKQCCLELQPAAEAKNLQLTYELGAGQTSIQADLALLARALQNVLTNAVRYTDAGGSIVARWSARSDAVVLSVQDTGIGIAAAELEKVRGEFYRAENTRRGEGTGLGLAIVERIISLHGGSLEIESTLGRGTVVRICLPRTAPRYQPESPTEAVQVSTHDSPRLKEFRGPYSTGVVVALTLISLVSEALQLSRNAEFHWLSSVVLLCLCGALLKSGVTLATRRSRYIAYALYVVLLLRTLIPAPAFIPVAFGTAIIASTFQLATHAWWNRRRLRALLLVLVTYLAVTHVQETDRYLIGVLTGAAIAVNAVIYDCSRDRYKFAPSAIRLAFIVGLSSALLACAALVFFLYSLSTSHLRGGAESLLQELSESSNLAEDGIAEFELELASRAFFNPWYDLYLFDAEGNKIADAGWRREFLPSLKFELPGASRTEAAVLHPRRDNSAMVLREISYGSATGYLVVRFPSIHSNHYLLRLFQYLAMFWAVALWLLVVPVAVTTVWWVSRPIAARFKALEEGLERFRRGDYSQPIRLSSADVLGRIVRAVNDLAARLPQLQAEARRSAENLVSFMQRCAFDLTNTCKEVEQRLHSVQAGEKETLQQLAVATTHQREILDNLLELFQAEIHGSNLLLEKIPLGEVLFEEIYRVADAETVSPELWTRGIQDSIPSVYGSADIIVEALRLYLKQSCDAWKYSSLPSDIPLLDLQHDMECVEIVIHIISETATASDVQFFDDPLQSGLGIDGSMLPLGGYRSAKLQRHFRDLGGSLRFSLSQSGVRVGIRLPREPRAATIDYAIHSEAE